MLSHSIVLRTAAVVAAFSAVSGDVQAADCITASGKTACGYGCVNSDGQVRCSQTPEGRCSTTSGVVICWDPPTLLKRAVPEKVGSVNCVTTNGQTACGYSCITAYGQVQCAQTPFGACRANEGKLVCWDPPARVILSRRQNTPVATCIAAYGQAACGYHCAANQGLLKCAQTPEGLCRAERDTVYCWDPPQESPAVTYDPATEVACLDSEAGRKCGFRCLATDQHAACGGSSLDSCHVEEDSIVCRSPY